MARPRMNLLVYAPQLLLNPFSLFTPSAGHSRGADPGIVRGALRLGDCETARGLVYSVSH